MSFTVTVSLLPLCRQSRKLTQLLYHAYLPILFTTWNTLLPELYFRISRKISFLLLKKNEIFFKTSFPTTKYMMMVCIMWQKIMKVDLKLKKIIIRNSKLLLVFLFSSTVRYAFPIWRQIFLTVTRRPVTWTSRFCMIYWLHDGCFNSIL